MTVAPGSDTIACPSFTDDAALVIMARTLAASGYQVRHHDEEPSAYLTVTSVPGLHCEITGPGSGDPQLDCWARDPAPGPQQVIAAVLGLLTGSAGHRPSSAGHRPPPAQHEPSSGPPSPTVWPSPRPRGLLPATGRGLRSAGLAVRLAVDADQQGCEAYAELIVTNPGQPQRGTVMVSDDGGIVWRCPPGPTPATRQAAEHTAKVLVRALSRYQQAPPPDGAQAP